MVRFVLAAALFGSLGFSAPSSGKSNSGAPTVHVKNGTITGLHQKTYNQDYFLGIPFAQAPVNDLRFRTPQSINQSYSSPLQATEYAPTCVGYGGDQIGYPVDEDCLYLNVVRPAGCEGQDLPVGVWIHGGGLVMGGTRDERYNLSFIVQNGVEIGKPFIGVSIAYRLNTWGFLSSEEVAGSGNTNLGLRDQRLALHWLQENIAAFGGDPKKVTIWGESAGAGSVGWHLTAYNGRDDGLFRAGIMESGNPVAYFSYRGNEFYQPLYNGLVKDAGCANATDSLDCLRHVPFDKLNHILNVTNPKYQGFTAVLDGDFIQRYGSIQLKEGNFVKVPIIDGANTDEGTSFGYPGINTTEQFVARFTSNQTGAYIAPQFAEQVLEAYPDTCDYYDPPPSELPCDAQFPSASGSMYRRGAAYGGDVTMQANRRGAMETWARNGIPAYSYRFNTRPAGLPWYVGVTHFQEVAFVFDNTQGLGYNAAHGTINPFQDKPKSYTDLANLMSKSWASFIADLDPNYEKTRPENAPQWPKYSLDKPENIVWDANVTALAEIEPDTWRAEGIRWILDNALAYHR